MIKKDKHEATLEQGIRHRHLVPFFLVAPKRGKKQTHQIPVI
jgi:hypothetical protein